MRKYTIAKCIALGAYISILAYGTLLGRQSNHAPLSVVFSGWMIWHGQKEWDIYPIYNIFLFTPLMFLLLCIFPKIGGENKRQLLKRAAWIGFLTSLFIECNQLIFCVGTFQISDLIYNMISSLIGAYMYLIYSRYVRK